MMPRMYTGSSDGRSLEEFFGEMNCYFELVAVPEFSCDDLKINIVTNRCCEQTQQYIRLWEKEALRPRQYESFQRTVTKLGSNPLCEQKKRDTLRKLETNGPLFKWFDEYVTAVAPIRNMSPQNGYEDFLSRVSSELRGFVVQKMKDDMEPPTLIRGIEYAVDFHQKPEPGGSGPPSLPPAPARTAASAARIEKASRRSDYRNDVEEQDGEMAEKSRKRPRREDSGNGEECR